MGRQLLPRRWCSHRWPPRPLWIMMPSSTWVARTRLTSTMPTYRPSGSPPACTRPQPGKSPRMGPTRLKDIYDIPGLDERVIAIMKKYEGNFVALPPNQAYVLDRINNGMYR